jgi:hypothetical protein
MKSYTDLEQSERLAKILPLESADMSYTLNFDSVKYEISTISYKSWVVPKYAESYKGLAQVIPCWSLAALLDILPLEVSFNKQTDGVDTYYYIVSCDTRYCDVYSHRHINVVDACYEMVTILKERNLV